MRINRCTAAGVFLSRSYSEANTAVTGAIASIPRMHRAAESSRSPSPMATHDSHAHAAAATTISAMLANDWLSRVYQYAHTWWMQAKAGNTSSQPQTLGIALTRL